MNIEKKLLVLVDGSERSVRTVNYVREFMPLDENMKIVLFHVFKGFPETYWEITREQGFSETDRKFQDWGAAQENKIRKYLEQMKITLVAGGFSEAQIEIKVHILETGVAQDIIEEAKQGYKAVVMSRRSMANVLQCIILGSVAVKLLESISFIPIIFTGPAPPVKKILLAVDASPCSMEAVDFVASFLGGQGYEVCIFHAIIGLGKVDFEYTDDSPMPDVNMPDLRIETFKLKVAHMMHDIKDRLVAAGFAPEKVYEKIAPGVNSRSEAIVKEAEDGNYGAIVVGRRGLSRVEAFFMGRVGHKVVYGGRQFTVWVV